MIEYVSSEEELKDEFKVDIAETGQLKQSQALSSSSSSHILASGEVSPSNQEGQVKRALPNAMFHPG